MTDCLSALRRVTALRRNIRGQSSPPDPSLAKGRRFHLYVSENNFGACAVAEELHRVEPRITYTSRLEKLDECEHVARRAAKAWAASAPAQTARAPRTLATALERRPSAT